MECSVSHGLVGSRKGSGIARRAVALLACWRIRMRERRQLARLCDAALRDIGVTRAEAVRESGKPFWRP